MNSGIYKITNIVNNKCYIGSANNLKRRKWEHFCNLKYNRHCNKKLQFSYNKYSKDNFIFEILAICPKEYCIKLEQWFIDKLKPEFNILTIANSRLGIKQSESQKQKSSESWKKIKKENSFKGNIKNTFEEILEIKKLIALNYPDTEIKIKFNISTAAIHKIKHNKTWKDVPDYIIKESDTLYKRNFIRNKKYDNEYYIAIIEKYLKSNMNPTKFCKENNLSDYTRKIITGTVKPEILNKVQYGL